MRAARATPGALGFTGFRLYGGTCIFPPSRSPRFETEGARRARSLRSSLSSTLSPTSQGFDSRAIP